MVLLDGFAPADAVVVGSRPSFATRNQPVWARGHTPSTVSTVERTHTPFVGRWMDFFFLLRASHSPFFLIVPNAHGSGSRNPVGWETKLIDTIGGMVGFVGERYILLQEQLRT